MPEGPSVLVVDDSPIVLDLVAGVLEDHGYTVTVTDKPLECERLFVELSPDVLVLDISMPELDGLSLLSLIRRKHASDCAMLLFSDRDHAELTATIRVSGADGGAVKSPGCEQLLSVMETVLKRKRRSRARASASRT